MLNFAYGLDKISAGFNQWREVLGYCTNEAPPIPHRRD